MDQPSNPGAARRVEQAVGTVDVDGGECCGSPLDDDADEVHDRVGTDDQPRKGGIVIERARNDLNPLACDVAGPGPVPYQCTDVVPAAQKQRREVAADKPGGTGNGN
jgi:hypothetical protein